MDTSFKPVLRPLANYLKRPEADMIKRSQNFYKEIACRRTIRDFSPELIPMEVINICIRSAGSAPSGANQQPWHFAVVTDPDVKAQIRWDAEKEEKLFYQKKSNKDWHRALEPLGTDWHKPFLEIAPCLIVIFAQSYKLSKTGHKKKNYYVQESVGIATGLLINALHHSGLVSLTHTPSPMGFLNKLCHRPINERPFMILVTGYPAADASYPLYASQKYPLNEISSHI